MANKPIADTVNLFKPIQAPKINLPSEQPKEIKEESVKPIQAPTTPNKPIKTTKNGNPDNSKSKNNYNYRAIFDNDLEDFMRNQYFLTHIKSTNQYINKLIREDLNKRLGTNNLYDDDLIQAWNNYKNK